MFVDPSVESEFASGKHVCIKLSGMELISRSLQDKIIYGRRYDFNPRFWKFCNSSLVLAPFVTSEKDHCLTL